MPQDAREFTVAYFPETTFRTGPNTFDSDGAVVEFLCIEPNPAGLRQATIENRNNRRRAFAPHRKLLGLRGGAAASFGIYASGSGATTAANSAATSFALVEILRNAWCGVHLGYASAVVTPGNDDVEITAAQGVNHPAGAPIFAMDAAGVGQFAIVSSEAADILTLRTETDEDVAVVGAAIACFPNTRGLTNRQHATHVTHSLHFRGEDTDDNYTALGCKYNITGLENTEAGGDAEFKVEVMAADFLAETLSHHALTGTPQGPPPPIVGRAGTAVRMAAVGTAALVDVGAYSFSFAPGIVNAPVPAVVPGGVAGYHSNGQEDTMIEIVVPYDDAWMALFRAQTHQHIMIQVGSLRGDAWGLYFPNAEIAEDPERGVSADETAITLRFRAREFTGTTHTEGTANYEVERARFLFLIAA